MKREAGWMSASVVALAAVYGVSTLQQGGSGEGSPAATHISAHTSQTAHPKTGTLREVYQGPCYETVEKLRSFFNLPEESKFAPPNCAPLNDNAPSRVADVQHIRFIIATVPDPKTQIPFAFDRQIEAIQQAAAGANYSYDSSWMPWENDYNDSLALLEDRDVLRDRQELRERQPGMILFRHSVLPHRDGSHKDDDSTGTGDAKKNGPPVRVTPYGDALVVFVVGEDATAGMNRWQFRNAVQWIKQLKGIPGRSETQIFGPHFTGSLPSLAELIQSDDIEPILRPQKAKYLDIFSGSVTSMNGAEKFFNKTHPDQSGVNPPNDKDTSIWNGLNVNFHSFQMSNATLTRLYFDYLRSIGVDLSRVAIVSEDLTTYGADTRKEAASENFKTNALKVNGKRAGDQTAEDNRAKVSGNDCDECSYFSYPRDISAVRAAYQEQALMGASSTLSATHRELRSDIADPDEKITDNVHRYGSSQTALSQEAVLLQIVSMFHAHQIQFIILRSSNQLDKLFLTKFFKVGYPEGRVVLIGNDLLLRRDIVTSGMNGVITLGTYPLVPDADHFTAASPNGPFHQHRAYTDDTAQGGFLALTFLLGKGPDDAKPIDPESPCLQDAPTLANIFLPTKSPYCSDPGDQSSSKVNLHTPGYASPFWLRKHPEQIQIQPDPPAAWVSVLGNDGFWPVATLDGRSILQDRARAVVWKNGTVVKNILPYLSYAWQHLLTAPQSILTAMAVPFRVIGSTPDRRLPLTLPFSMIFCVGVVIVWAMMHVVLCTLPSITVKPFYRSYFARPYADPDSANPSALPQLHRGLILFASFLVVSVADILARGYGWTSFEGEPFQRDRVFFALAPILVWFLGAVAVCSNIWVESQLLSINPKTFTFGDLALGSKFLRTVWRPLLAFTLLTFGFYSFFILAIDSTLPPQVRTPTYLRAMDLITGVSPTTPLILLALGMYGWCWYALRGIGLLGISRPILPSSKHLYNERSGSPEPANHLQIFNMICRQGAGHVIERFCEPLSRMPLIGFFIALFLLLMAAYGLTSDWTHLTLVAPIRALGTESFSHIVCIWITIAIAMLLATCWQLTKLWLALHELLLFLDKIPLRRTIQSIRGFTWGSIWKLGGNILEFRYRLIYRQFEAIAHVRAALGDKAEYAALATTLDDVRPARNAFETWYSDNWNRWQARDLLPLYDVQKSIAKAVGELFSCLLVPAWEKEDASLLILRPTITEFSDDEGEHLRHVIKELPPEVRNAEEAFCLLYVGFIQNVLARMRTIVLGIISLFLSLALLVPSYPFDPRPLLTGAVVVLFAIISTVVFLVYSQMFRDTTLSHLTNTRPGELGAEFWFKFVGFGIGPIFGLLATIFPQLGNFFSSWLQPSISSLK
jgi:hypothetical protein